ncbi:MAG: flippase [Candidatus Gracilibacteria bacterium]
MSTARKILFNTVSQVIGKACVALIGVFIIKIITSYLGKTGYGEYTTAFDYLALFSIIADLGLYTIGIREMSKDKDEIPKIMGNVLTIRTVFAIFTISIAAFVSFFIPQYQGTHIPPAVMLAGLAAFCNILTTVISAVLQVNLKMEYNSLGSVIGKLVSLSYMVFIVYILRPVDQSFGFFQFIVAGIMGNVAMLAVTWHYARKFVPIRFQFDKAYAKSILIKALPYGLALILNTVSFRIGSFALSILRTKAEVGIYGVPMRMLEAVGIIPLYFMNAVLPPLTQAIHRRDGSHQKIIQFAFDFLVMGSLPIVFGTFILAYPIVSIISSPEFLSHAGIHGSDTVLPILIFALSFSFINSLFAFILIAADHQMKILLRNIIGTTFIVIFSFTLIPRFGVLAAAYGNVITEGYMAVASYLLAKHYLKFKLNFTNTLKIIVSALTMAGVIYAIREPLFTHLQNKSVLILVPLGGVIYVGMLFLTKAISKDMINMIRKPKAMVVESAEESRESSFPSDGF